MHDVFLFTLILGAGVLLVGIVLELAGLSHHVDVDHAGASAGLELLSVRSIAAAATLFGAVGLALESVGLPMLISTPVAILGGLAAAVGTAWITRQMLRLESDGSLQLENAVGQPGTVYLPVPARRQGFGMVQFPLQGRTVELRAIADEEALIPTGAAVIVTSVVDAQTVEVMPTSRIEGIV